MKEAFRTILNSDEPDYLVRFKFLSALFAGGLILVAILLAISERKSSGGQSNCSSVNQDTDSDSQTESDIVEDSEGDGLMKFDDPMFPPEFDDERWPLMVAIERLFEEEPADEEEDWSVPDELPDNER